MTKNIPYRHGRASLGLEARTTVGEINANRYWATTGWQAGANDMDEHALGGVDLEIGIPLPYMNWATFYAKAFKWNTEIPGEKDSIGNVFFLSGLKYQLFLALQLKLDRHNIHLMNPRITF